ncbi:translocase of outer mitochondrial membrane [Basidiobolus ranarum]|uniref:Translocase of outer mitochondrial membrane n=1 Tax=Basidiobolus ranarum TaxID=34480 RepID=A0ABR2WCG0_9FUNG
MSGSDLAQIWNPLYLVQRFNEYKASLGLPNPGSYEALQREVKNTFLTNHVFDGARADLTKVLSQNFQVTHSFSLGSMVMPPTYSFGTVFVGAKSFLQRTIDSDGWLIAGGYFGWAPNMVSKIHC